MNSRNASDKREIDYSSLFVVALFAIMLIGIMVLSAVGGGLFDTITENRFANMNRRAALSYVTARITAADEAGAVRIDHASDGDVLILSDPSGEKGYESRIFLQDGYLVEALSASGSQVSTEPQKVAAAKEFSIVINGSVVSVTTEEGTRMICLHTGEAVK